MTQVNTLVASGLTAPPVGGYVAAPTPLSGNADAGAPVTAAPVNNASTSDITPPATYNSTALANTSTVRGTSFDTTA